MDYTPFLFSYNKRPQPKQRNVNCGGGGRIRKNIGSIILIVIIISCLIVSLLLAGKFSGEQLFETAIEALIKEVSFNYYVVSRAGVSSEESAKVQSAMVRAGGGAGYIYSQDNQYFVAMATYIDKNSADSVAEKNKDTIVITLTLNLNKDYASSFDEEYLNKTLELMQATLAVLDDTILKYAKNEMQVGEVVALIESERNKLLELKALLLDSSCEGRDALVATIDPLFGGLEAIVSSNTNSGLLASLRYVYTAGAVSLCKLGNENQE